jgi:hypothetical protein
MSRLLACLACLAAAPFAAQGQQSANVQTDAIGNLVGSKHDWIKANEFAGKRILMTVHTKADSFFQYVPDVLRSVGFTVDTWKAGAEPLPDLRNYDQCWVVSGGTANPDLEKHTQSYLDFVGRGKGLYVLSDNEPLFVEANAIAQKLHGATISGNYEGEQLIRVLKPGELRRLSQGALRAGRGGGAGQRAGVVGGQLYAEDHELLSGLNALYEGTSISNIAGGRDLEVILQASDGKPLVAVSKRPKERIVYDCGFTRMFYRWEENAVSNARWYQNVAGYLMGKTRSDLPGRKSATLDASANSKLSSGRLELLSADELRQAYASADAQLKQGIVQQLHDRKGNEFTDALAGLIGEMDEQEKPNARKLLSARMARMTEQTLRGKLESDDDEVVLASISAAQQRQRVTLADQLIELLLHNNRQVSSAARDALQALTKQDFGPADNAGTVQRFEAQKRWQRWWQQRSKAAN